ncbi:MAG: hypothetical protein E7496_04960 [Ruminococcus sp.]|nr:hypothetical protein [Ruminococcus sp.]
MKKTRKLFAGLTALCLSGTMLSALPVNAEDTVYATYSYTVVGTDNAEHPAKYVFADSSGDTWYTSADYFDMTLAVGDMITIQNAMLGVTCIEGTNDLSIDKLDGYSEEKTGSILDNPKTAEFTVQEIQTGSQFGNRIYLEKDGVRYHIFTDWIEKNYAEYSYLDWDSVSVGDTVTCILYDDYPVIATELVSETENPYQRFFIVTDAENHIAEYYYHIDDEILHTPADFRNVTADWNFTFGDLLTVEGDFYIKNGFPLLIKLDDTAVLSSQSCRDAFEIKELTVTEVLSDDVQQNIQLSLTDENGSSYSYTEHTGMNYDFSIADASSGKTYLFAVYEDTALLPIEMLSPDGDADGNQELDILDVISINKTILGKEELPLTRISHIDFNNNGIPDSEDSLIMMKTIVGLV